jgi:hypothetical protein
MENYKKMKAHVKLITSKNNKSRYKLKTMSKHYDFARKIL